MDLNQERSCAMGAVVAACGLCRAVQAQLVNADTLAKADKSPVTVADFGAQAVVNLRLLSAFPSDSIVGEEDADALRQPDGEVTRKRVIEQVQALDPNATEEGILSAIDAGTSTGGATGRHWILDPIDGTKGFLRGDQYAIALALMVDGEIVLGVLGCPNLPVQSTSTHGARGCVFVAARDAGTAMLALEDTAELPVQVSDVQDPTQATFCESVESAHTAHGDAERIAEKLGITNPPYRIDSQCKYAAIARGDASIYLRLPTRKDYEERIWDHAAGYIVVKEAGGDVTDIRGNSLDFTRGRTLAANQGIVATNGQIHAPVIDAVRAVLGV